MPWQEAIDPASNKTYYFDPETSETRWRLPDDAESGERPSYTKLFSVEHNRHYWVCGDQVTWKDPDDDAPKKKKKKKKRPRKSEFEWRPELEQMKEKLLVVVAGGGGGVNAFYDAKIAQLDARLRRLDSAVVALTPHESEILKTEMKHLAWTLSFCLKEAEAGATTSPQPQAPSLYQILGLEKIESASSASLVRRAYDSVKPKNDDVEFAHRVLSNEWSKKVYDSLFCCSTRRYLDHLKLLNSTKEILFSNGIHLSLKPKRSWPKQMVLWTDGDSLFAHKFRTYEKNNDVVFRVELNVLRSVDCAGNELIVVGGDDGAEKKWTLAREEDADFFSRRIGLFVADRNRDFEWLRRTYYDQ